MRRPGGPIGTLLGPALLPLTFVTALLPPQVGVTGAGGTPHVTPLRVVLGIGLALTAVQIARHPRGLVDGLPRSIVVAASAFMLYVVVVSATFGSDELARGLSYSFEELAPAVFAVVWVRTSQDRLRALDVFVTCIAVAAAAGIVELATQHYLLAADGRFVFHAPDMRAGSIRVQGLMPHPLVLGGLLASALPIAVARLGTVATRRGRILLSFGIAVMVVALFFTGSRGPWVAALAGLVLLGAMANGGLRRAVLGGAVILILLVVVSPYRSEIGNLARNVVHPQPTRVEGASVQYREVLLRFTVDYSLHHLTGAGAGNSGDLGFHAFVGRNETDVALSVDNAFAKFSLEIGPAGLVLFLGLYAAVLRATWRGRRGDHAWRLLASGCFAAEVGVLVTSLTVATFTWAQFAAVFWGVAGLAVVQVERPDPRGGTLFGRADGRPAVPVIA